VPTRNVRPLMARRVGNALAYTPVPAARGCLEAVPARLLRVLVRAHRAERVSGRAKAVRGRMKLARRLRNLAHDQRRIARLVAGDGAWKVRREPLFESGQRLLGQRPVAKIGRSERLDGDLTRRRETRLDRCVRSRLS